MKSSTKTIVSILSALLILVLVGGAIYLIFKYTNGGSEGFKTFYLTHDGEGILSSSTERDTHVGQTYTYGVKYTFDFTDGEEQAEKRDYSVEILPNDDEDFTFYVDGKAKKWSDEKDFNELFGLKKEKDSFSFSVVENCSNVRKVLEERYPGKEVELDGDSFKLPYVLTVSNSNKSITYEIAFTVLPAITDIELGVGEIIL